MAGRPRWPWRALRRTARPLALSALVAACSSCESCASCGSDEEPTGSSSTVHSSGGSDTASHRAPGNVDATAGDSGLADLRTEEGFQAAHHSEGDAGARRRGSQVELGAARGYLSLPAQAEPPLPAVLVAPDRHGLNDHAALWADRLAAHGYGALVVDLYDGALPLEGGQREALLEKLDEQQVEKLLRQGLTLLKTDPRVRASHQAVLGWGAGAGWAVELATREPELDAVVVYYGPATSDASRLADLECPLLALFGNADERLPKTAADRFEMGLEQAGGKSYRVLRLDAGHGFADPTAPGYEPAVAAEAWGEARSFLQEHLTQQDAGAASGHHHRRTSH